MSIQKYHSYKKIKPVVQVLQLQNKAEENAFRTMRLGQNAFRTMVLLQEKSIHICVKRDFEVYD